MALFAAVVLLIPWIGVAQASTPPVSPQADSIPQVPPQTEEIFDDCVGMAGAAYRDAVRTFLWESDTLPWLRSLCRDLADESDRARIARILIARTTHPEVFDELRACFEKNRHCGRCDGVCRHTTTRPGFFGGSLTVFLRLGPRSRFVMERGEMKLTEHGWRTERIKVEKYTEADVAAGVARNTAAAMAFLEYALKFFEEATEYEQREIIFALAEVWGRRSSVIKREEEGLKDDLTEALMLDSTRPYSIRITAACVMPPSKLPLVIATMFQLIPAPGPGERDRHYRYLSDALSIIATYGTEADLKRLRAVETGEQWQRELMERRIEDMLHMLEWRRTKTR